MVVKADDVDWDGDESTVRLDYIKCGMVLPMILTLFNTKPHWEKDIWNSQQACYEIYHRVKIIFTSWIWLSFFIINILHINVRKMITVKLCLFVKWVRYVTFIQLLRMFEIIWVFLNIKYPLFTGKSFSSMWILIGRGSLTCSFHHIFKNLK